MTTDQSNLDAKTSTTGREAAGPAAGKPATGDPAEQTRTGADTQAGTETKERAGTGTEAQTGNGTKEQAGAGAETQPADPWTAFAPAPEPVPTRPRRIGNAVGRGLVHEWTLAVFGSLLLAVVMTWPTLRYPLYTIPQDTWDPTLQAWQMAWSGHILLTDPAQLWHANAFYPESWSFAFSDTLLGYAPAGLLGEGPAAAVLRYNIMFVLAHALATFGAYALVRQLGSGRIGAAAAGVGFAYAPWLLSQAGHLHVLSNGGIPLALAMLARGHGWSLRYGYRPPRTGTAKRRASWAVAGWLVASWQLSLGFGIGLPFAYVLGLVMVVAVVGWLFRRALRRPRRPRRPVSIAVVVVDVLGGLVFAATGVLLSLPYFKVTDLHPHAARSLADVSAYSPPPFGFFTAPAESLVWGDLHERVRAGLPWHPEMTLLPGFVLYALAIAGLFFSIWTLRQRLLLLAAVLVSMVLAMGTWFFEGTYTYAPLVEYLPGWNGLRTPGRLTLWTTLLLGILAAGAISAFGRRAWQLARERVPPRPGPLLRLATLLPLVLILVEGLNTTPHPIVPQQPTAMRTISGPLLVLPSSQKDDQHAMLWSTTRFQDIMNGGSGFTPRKLDEARRITQNFPDPESIQYLRDHGVRTVVLLRDRVAGTPWQTTIDLPVDSLGIEREDIDEVVVFRL